jgi:hypothetical protein
MKIETNLPADPIHDNIRYPSIEKQVYDAFKVVFPDPIEVKYETGRQDLVLEIGGSRISVQVGKKSAKIALMADYDIDGVRFGNHNTEYPSVRLPYNKETDKLTKFCAVVQKVRDLEDRAKTLKKENKVDTKKIDKFLNAELAIPEVEVRYWREDFFSGVPVLFSISPKGTAPADGVMVCIEKDSTIKPWWNCSTPQRSSYGKIPEGIDRALGHRDGYHAAPQPQLEALKKKIDAIERLQAKIDAFDPKKCKELVKLLALHEQGDKLFEEFKDVVGKSE